MKVELGEAGLDKSWQNGFPKETKCCRCEGMARIGFVAHEVNEESPHVCDLHDNDYKSKKNPDGKGYWLHDCCTVAIYFCRECLEPTALCDQA